MSRIEPQNVHGPDREQHLLADEERRRWDDERRPGCDVGDRPFSVRWSRC